MPAAAAAGSLACVTFRGECVNDVLASRSRRARRYGPAGRVVEKGSHDELMARRGLYAQLFSLQARAYADGPV